MLHLTLILDTFLIILAVSIIILLLVIFILADIVAVFRLLADHLVLDKHRQVGTNKNNLPLFVYNKLDFIN